jgi:hypothetical protein
VDAAAPITIGKWNGERDRIVPDANRHEHELTNWRDAARRRISYLEVAGPKRELELDGTAGLAEADKILGH